MGNSRTREKPMKPGTPPVPSEAASLHWPLMVIVIIYDELFGSNISTRVMYWYCGMYWG